MASVLLYITAPCSPAMTMAGHIGSANVICMIENARNSEMLGLVQYPSAVKPKLMMRGGRHVSMGDFMKIIMTKSHPSLFPTKK